VYSTPSISLSPWNINSLRTKIQVFLVFAVVVPLIGNFISFN